MSLGRRRQTGALQCLGSAQSAEGGDVERGGQGPESGSWANERARGVEERGLDLRVWVLLPLPQIGMTKRKCLVVTNEHCGSRGQPQMQGALSCGPN